MSTKELKFRAFELLRENWVGILIFHGVNVLVSALLGGNNALALSSAIQYGNYDAILSSVSGNSLLTNLWTILFAYFLLIYYFNIRENKRELRDVFSEFNLTNFLMYIAKTFVAGLILSAITIVGGIIVALFAAVGGEGTLLLSFILLLVAIVWGTLSIIPVSYLAIEFPELGVFETIGESFRIMKNNKMRYIILHLSLLGWYVLLFAILSLLLMLSSLNGTFGTVLGIGLVALVTLIFSAFITPYTALAQIELYYDIKG